MITVAESIKKKAEEMKVTTVTKIDRSKAENKDGNSAVPSDKVMGVINEINTVVDLFTSISSLIKDKDRGYSENLIQTYNQITTSDFTSTINQLKVIIKLLAKRDPELQAMIPQLKSLKS
jgi:cobalamin biosynthesis Co2+ chelatase CbiK